MVSTIWIGVDRILGGVVSTAVRGVESVEEVVERGAFDVVSGLVESNVLFAAYEGHTVLEIEVGFAVVFEACLITLHET